MIAVLYDPETGKIKQTMVADPHIIAANGSYLEVPVHRSDYDRTHIVQDGKLVEKDRSLLMQQKINELKIIAISKRNNLLSDTDWVELPSAANRLSPELMAEYETYRQALRDITQNPEFPVNINWPTLPK